jgi:hypothetical protein
MADLLADNRHHQVGIYENAHLADTSHLRDKISLVLADFSLQVNICCSFKRILNALRVLDLRVPFTTL